MSFLTTDGTHPADVLAADLIDDDLFHQLTARVAHQHNQPTEYAGRIIEQTLLFLYACARNPGVGLTPSPEVDLGWHTFILDTHNYADWCQRVAGRFLHHNPEEPGNDKAAFAARLGDSINAMHALGLTVDPALWLTAGECSQCYQGCADDPSPEGITA
ncbi:glycine-rich domain-containing protein [Nonomuraea wenchangensis]